MTPFGKLLVTFVRLDRSSEEALRLYSMLATSLTLHAALALGLVMLPQPSSFEETTTIAVEMVELLPEEPPPAEPEPEPVVESPPEPVPPRVERPKPRLTPSEPPRPDDPPPAEEPPAAEEAIADFTGQTLTNEAGAGWQSATGNGEAMEGPIGQPGAEVTGRRRRGAREGVVGGEGDADAPRIVPMSDLSRPPGIPNVERLQMLLRRNYPERLRELGVEGTARVRIRVRADGRVQPLAVLSEEHEGFGRACRQTLRSAGHFDPPLDRSGEPVDTITSFTCTFQIRF